MNGPGIGLAVPGSGIVGAGDRDAAGPAATPSQGGRSAKRSDPGKQGAEAGKKSKKKLIVIVAVVLLLAVAAVVLKGKLLGHHYGPGQVPPAGQVVSLGTVTTSLSDGHLVQTTIQLQLTVATSPKQEAKEQPALLNAAIATLGGETYQALLPAPGRARLKAALLKDFRSVLDRPNGPVMVSAVLLTSFVLQ